jgi:hypothetical protein
VNAHAPIAKFLDRAFEEDTILSDVASLLAARVHSKAMTVGEAICREDFDLAFVASELAQIRPTLIEDKPSSTVTALQEWEGYVLSVEPETFTARLLDITANARTEQEVAEFDKSELSEADRELLREGAVFRWVIGNQITRGGQKRRLSTRVDALERQYLATVPRMESVIRLETKVDGLTSGLQELKAMLRGREARP